MRLSYILLGLVILGVTLFSCAPSGPSTLEVLNSLETSLNDKDKNGVMVLFAEDATTTGNVWSYNWNYEGIVEIEILINSTLKIPQKFEFRESCGRIRAPFSSPQLSIFQNG